ncbi:hypothetical protein NDU88_004644 [Pleurodeles waltl]|uniref:Uncharacterized protein n=1 Tax=Pleurodeles waltl TaxID=8319 RepID=A0AAV7UFS0_PLEWA|nr:hypothetical protein NDU88_004644 [Pleurodeles waltl]
MAAGSQCVKAVCPHSNRKQVLNSKVLAHFSHHLCCFEQSSEYLCVLNATQETLELSIISLQHEKWPETLSECAPRTVHTTNWRRAWDYSPFFPPCERSDGGEAAEPRRPGRSGDASGDESRERQKKKKKKNNPGTVPRRHEERRRNH